MANFSIEMKITRKPLPLKRIESFKRDFVVLPSIATSEIVAHDGYRWESGIGCVYYYDMTYAVVDTMAEGAINRTIYGTVPKHIRLLDEEEENRIIRENEARIDKARPLFKGSEDGFLWALHLAIVRWHKEILGIEDMPSFVRKSAWIGDFPDVIYQTAIVPEGRFSVPFYLEVEGDCLEPWLDRESPDADLLSMDVWRGGPVNGLEVRIVWSQTTDRGFTSSMTDWPEEVPVNHTTLSRVVDKLGKNRNCCGGYPDLREGEIRKLF